MVKGRKGSFMKGGEWKGGNMEKRNGMYEGSRIKVDKQTTRWKRKGAQVLRWGKGLGGEKDSTISTEMEKQIEPIKTGNNRSELESGKPSVQRSNGRKEESRRWMD